MPAKNLQRITEGGTFCHIYNRGVENRKLFVDDEDYQVFLGFLEEYLSHTSRSEVKKTEFTIKGKSYKGIPHLPKNYHNKIELIAYCLQPDSFHLVLHQKEKKSLQAFLRSLCTRYSIYFNKKYHRTGSLFNGPYKSRHVIDNKALVYLVNQLNNEGAYTTQPEYSGQQSTDWVCTNIVLSIVGKSDNIKTYLKDFKLPQEEIIIKGEEVTSVQNQSLERRDLEIVSLKPWSRIPELAAASAVLVLLLGLGFRNISTASKSNAVYPVTLGTSTTAVSPSPIPSPQPNIKSGVNETEATSQADTKQPNSDD